MSLDTGTPDVRLKFALVTGGAGFIGTHLVSRLLSSGVKVRVLDDFSASDPSVLRRTTNTNLEVIRGDLKRSKICHSAAVGPDTVFHLAANPEVRLSTTNPRTHFYNNVVATYNLLEGARKSPTVGKLIFASSSSVYGETSNNGADEDTPLMPRSVYGATKVAGESLLQSYGRLYGIRSVALRFANVVGPGSRHGIIYDLVKKLFEDSSKLEVLGDGKQSRSYLYVDDAIDALLRTMATSQTFAAYNIASRDWLSVTEVAKTVARSFGAARTSLTYKPSVDGTGWPGDVHRLHMKVAKAASVGFRAKFSSRQAVRLATRTTRSELGLSITRAKT